MKMVFALLLILEKWTYPHSKSQFIFLNNWFFLQCHTLGKRNKNVTKTTSNSFLPYHRYGIIINSCECIGYKYIEISLILDVNFPSLANSRYPNCPYYFGGSRTLFSPKGQIQEYKP